MKKNKEEILYQGSSLYNWHLISIILILVFTTIFGSENANIFFSMVGISTIIIFTLLWINRRITFYTDFILIESAIFKEKILTIPSDSIQKIEYKDSLKTRFDNEKVKITFFIDGYKRTKYFPLYNISDSQLYNLLINFKKLGVKTSINSKRKIFTQ